ILINDKNEQYNSYAATIDAGEGVYTSGRVYAEYLSFYIQESTETSLAISPAGIEAIVQNSPAFFLEKRDDKALEASAQSIALTDWVEQMAEAEETPAQIVKAGSFEVTA